MRMTRQHTGYGDGILFPQALRGPLRGPDELAVAGAIRQLQIYLPYAEDGILFRYHLDLAGQNISSILCQM